MSKNAETRLDANSRDTTRVGEQAKTKLSDEASHLMREHREWKRPPVVPLRGPFAFNDEDKATQLTRIETTRALAQGERDSGLSLIGGTASVSKDLAIELAQSIPDLANMGHLKEHNKTILVGSTNNAPAVLDSRLAQVTRPYEERLVRVLTGKDSEIRLSDSQRANLSQGDLALIARKISPDTSTAVLTLANFTKNMTARMRDIAEPGGGDGISADQITDDGLRKAYSDSNVRAIAAQIDTVNEQAKGSDSFSSGLIYHYYGALAASYFLRDAGSLAVAAQSAMVLQKDATKAIANTQGAEAGMDIARHQDLPG